VPVGPALYTRYVNLLSGPGMRWGGSGVYALNAINGILSFKQTPRAQSAVRGAAAAQLLVE